MTNLSGANLNNGAAVGPQGEGRESPSNFPKYPAYKDSGVPWIGEVPTAWEVKPFKWLLDNNDGGVWGNDPTGEADTVVLRSTDQTVDGNWRVADPALRNLSAKEKASALLVEGDLVVTKSSGSSLHIGKTTLVTADIAEQGCCYGNFMQRLRVNSSFIPKLAWYVMNNELARSQLDLLSNSTTGLANLNGALIGEVLLPVATAGEQTQIARFLDHETARIDALIEEQQRLIELLKEKRQAVISHAVTKGLDPTVPMKDSGVEWLGEVPAHWEIKQLKHVVDPNSSITYGIVQAGPEFEGGVPYIRTSDMSGEELPVSGYPLTSPDIDKSYARSRVRPGDIVMSIRASVGKCLPVPDELKVANLTQGTAKISAGQQITRNFLLAFLNAGATQNYFDLMAKGATFKEITLDALRRTPVLLPPAKEQVDIDQFVARHAGLLDETCKQALQSVALLQERRSALISAAVTGKIDVRGWQPPVSTQAPKFEVAEAN